MALLLALLLGAGLVVFLSALFAWPVMLLWNWLMPTIFHLPTVTFWQALGLMLLAGFLFQRNPGSGAAK